MSADTDEPPDDGKSKVNILHELNYTGYMFKDLWNTKRRTIAANPDEFEILKKDYNSQLHELHEHLFNHLGGLKKLDIYGAFKDE